MIEKDDLVWRRPLRPTAFNAALLGVGSLLAAGLIAVLVPSGNKREIKAEPPSPPAKRQVSDRPTQLPPAAKSLPPPTSSEALRVAETAEVLRLGTFATRISGRAGSGRSEMSVYLAETQSYLIVRIVSINRYEPRLIIDINRNRREDYSIDFEYTDWGDRDSPSIRAMYTIGIDTYALENYGYRREISTTGFVTSVRYARRQIERWTDEYVFAIPKSEAALDGTNVSFWVGGGNSINGAQIRPVLFDYKFAEPVPGRTLDEFLRYHHSRDGVQYTGPKLD